MSVVSSSCILTVAYGVNMYGKIESEANGQEFVRYTGSCQQKGILKNILNYYII